MDDIISDILEDIGDDELKHYGVKGMKWGVRKKRYSSSFDNDMVIKKGTSIQNISMDKKKEISNKPIYTAVTKKDKLSYAGFYAQQLQDIQGAKSVYKNDLQVVKDIKIPSQKKAVEMFKDTFAKDPKGMARCIARSKADVSLFKNLGKSINMDVESRVYRKYMKKGEQWLETKGYEYFNQSIANDKSAKARDAYFKALTSKGYSGVLDVNDINNSYASEAPVIVINPKNNVREGKSTKMTQTEMGLSLLKYAEKYEPDLTDYAKMVLDEATKAEKKKDNKK